MLSGSLGSLHAFSVFLEPLERSFSATRAEVSLLYSLATACLTLSLLGGHVLYRLIPPAALAGLVGLVAAIGMAVAGAGSSLLVIGFGYSVLFGMANGIGYGFSLQIARQALPDRKGFAIGAVTAAYAFGVVIFARVFAVLIAVGGAGTAMLVMAGVLLCAGAGAASLLKLSRAGEFAPAPLLLPIDGALRDRRLFSLLWTGYCLAAAAGLMAMGHAAGIVAAKGGQAEQLVFGTMLIGLGNGAGGFTAGWLADRWPGRILLMFFTILSAAVLALLAYTTSPVAAIVALASVGFAYGGIIAIYPIAIADYYRPEDVAKVFGRVFTAWGIAGLAAPWIAGILFDASGSYVLALALAAVAALFAAATAMTLPCVGLPSPEPG
ncbi:MFS transporter [Rhodospirillaceae bacterium SYSU D60014]|uniref:MFS transporter n=1 Tax=Virgifigura deserti TaxID=2268457 RepID=UPI0013C40C98